MTESPGLASVKVVLVIDDDEKYAATLSEMLNAEGYHVLTAINGKQAMDVLRMARVDLVITDVLMPDKGGIETVAELRRARPALPVIAISGGGRTGNMDFLRIAKKAGARATLTKPVGFEDLRQAFRQVFEEKAGGAGG